jgi:sugar porter (SP) family MFS transporter
MKKKDTDVMKTVNQTGSLFYIVLVAALGGFLFGFDSGVISGCEKAIQTEFSLSALWHGLIVSGALIGTVIGVFGAGAPSDRWGRRPTLWLMGTLFLISALGCAFTPTDAVWGPHLLGWMRFIGGLAIGGVSVVVPLYIVEMSPGPLRGRLVATNQLNIVFGILISYVSNYFVARWMAVEGSWFRDLCCQLANLFAANTMTVDMVRWRVMLGMECLPIVLFMALLTTIPESPRWLVRVGRKEQAVAVLTAIGYPDVERTIVEIRDSLSGVSTGEAARLFQRRYLKPILLAFFIAFFNQVSGINAINYYAPRIFDLIFGSDSGLASLAGTMGVGTVNLIFTALAFLVIDKFGRRVMIIGGSALMILMHSLVAWQLSLGDQCNAVLAVTGILGFIAFFACSSGAVIWVYISEVFPNAVRAKGQALGCFTHWFMCTIISWAFPVVAERAGTWAFAFFACMMAVQLLWAVFFMPETKGGTIEDIERRLGLSDK